MITIRYISAFIWKVLQYFFTHVLLLCFFVCATVIGIGVFVSFSLLFAGVPINFVQMLVSLIPMERNINFLWHKIGYFEIPFFIAYAIFYGYMLKSFLLALPYYIIGSAWQLWKEAWGDTFREFSRVNRN